MSQYLYKFGDLDMCIEDGLEVLELNGDSRSMNDVDLFNDVDIEDEMSEHLGSNHVSISIVDDNTDDFDC